MIHKIKIQKCSIVMKTSKTWMRPLLTSNPERAYRLYRSAGPVPCSTRGKRAIVVGAISSDGGIIESFEFLKG